MKPLDSGVCQEFKDYVKRVLGKFFLKIKGNDKTHMTHSSSEATISLQMVVSLLVFPSLP